jgi:hypothetical protein
MFAILWLLMSFQSHALVRVNEGPAFALKSSTTFGIMTQDGLVASYVAWNTLNEPTNKAMKYALIATAKLQSSKLEKTKFKPLDLNENYLSFSYKDANGQYNSWNFIDTKYGFCHGMTMVTRQFAYLAKFRPDRKLKDEYSYKRNPKAWLKYYKAVVDSIMSGKKTDVVGFHNLSEFSSSPIQDYIQRHAAEQWAMNTARLRMYTNVYHSNFEPLTVQSLNTLKLKIQSYLSKNFYPRIILGPGHYRLEDPHVVMVTKLGVEANCLNIQFFDVGGSGGGSYRTLSYCVGDYAWIVDDDYLYYYDFAFQ